MYEVRTHDDPGNLPLGGSTLSRHRTPQAAFHAIDREMDALQRQPGQRNSYVMRVVVAVGPANTEIVQRHPQDEEGNYTNPYDLDW